ncbi:MAG: hypothetical protein H0V29_03415 [Thermoleophilaceae bacterium]|nr:hypothetical protein [Thermoleophilaceae bacterium]
MSIAAIVSPRTLMRAYGLSPEELTGASGFAWRLFAVRTLYISAFAVRGEEWARARLDDR